MEYCFFNIMGNGGVFLIACAVILSGTLISMEDAYAVDGETITERTAGEVEHDTAKGQDNSLVQLDADTYVLAYQGDGEGVIATFTISADGTTLTEVASLVHDDSQGKDNSLVKLDSDTFVLAYKDSGDDGTISTFTINAAGTSIVEAASIVHEADKAKKNSLVKVDSDTFALAYEGTGTKGFITTFTINAAGTSIVERVAGQVEHDGTKGQDNSLVQVDSDTFALAYKGSGNDGIISTFTINADGTTLTEVASIIHDAGKGQDNSLVKVDSDTFALAYEGDGNDGIISTFTINAAGTSIVEAASIIHDAGKGKENSLVKLDSDTYVLAYAADGDDGTIATFTIPTDGSSITEVTSLVHAAKAKGNSLVKVDSDTYALAYEGNVDGGGEDDGFITTFSISVESSSTSTSATGLGSGSSAHKHKTKPTFGLDHNTFLPLVEGGFRFNSLTYDITHNFWTPFEEQKIKLGEINSFAAKVFPQQKLRVQEFLFGIPQVGEVNKAELGIEVFYNRDGEIEKVKIIQKTNIIDIDSVRAITFKANCLSSETDEKCVTTLLLMKFLEPLKHNVMAIKAIDFKGRSHITYLNEGFDISGDSLNPMKTKLIPGTVKYEGLIEITQTAKYSDIWVAKDGREFEIDKHGSFAQINQSFKRPIETGKLENRDSLEFSEYKQDQINKAKILAEKLYPNYTDEPFNKINDIFAYEYPKNLAKSDDPIIQAALLAENLKAKEFLDKFFEEMYPAMGWGDNEAYIWVK